MNALIVFPSILIFWFFLIWVHSGLLPLLQQFAHVMILDWIEKTQMVKSLPHFMLKYWLEAYNLLSNVLGFLEFCSEATSDRVCNEYTNECTNV